MSKGLQALCYLDDIAHGRKMSLDPHELKLIIEKELKALAIIKKIVKIVDYSDHTIANGNLVILQGGEIKTKEEYELLREILL